MSILNAQTIEEAAFTNYNLDDPFEIAEHAENIRKFMLFLFIFVWFLFRRRRL